MKSIGLLLLTGYCWLWCNPILAQTADTTNKPSITTSRSRIPEGAGVVGIYDGREPCAVRTLLQLPISAGCQKVKSRLSLYCDATTGQPTTFSWLEKGGRWIITKGMKDNPHAIIYQLNPDKAGEPVYILKGDQNVLFILDKNRDFIMGDADFSYTLNRVVNKP